MGCGQGCGQGCGHGLWSRFVVTVVVRVKSACVVQCNPCDPLAASLTPCVHGRYLTPFKTVWDPKDLNEGTLVCGRYAFSQCTLCSCVSHCTPVTAIFWCLGHCHGV